jgi:replicative DNA helicase
MQTSNIELEKIVVGALVLHKYRGKNGYDSYLIAKLKDELFTFGPVKEIFKVACARFADGSGIDDVELIGLVSDAAADIITERMLSDFIPSPTIDRYIEDLTKLSVIRPKMFLLKQAIQEISQADSIDKGYEALQALAGNLSKDEVPPSYSEHISEIIDEVMTKDDEPDYLQTNLKHWPPFPSMGMITVAGRSGVGKTLMGLHLMEHILQVKPDTQALYFNTEMSKKVILSRYVNMVTPFSGPLKKALEDGGACEILKRDVTIISKSSIQIGEIELTASCHALNKPVSVIVVDYVGQVRDAEGGGKQYQEFGRIAQALSGLAYKLGCIVIALQQVSRNDPQKVKADTVPQSYEAAGSIDFERSSEWWLGIDQPQIHDPHNPSVKNIFVVKNRKSRGNSGYFTVYHGFQDARFLDADQREIEIKLNNQVSPCLSHLDAYKY